MSKANEYLHLISRIENVDEASSYRGDVLLYPKDAEFLFTDYNLIRTYGLDEALDRKERDLIRVIEVENALDLEYKQTNILTPLIYAESLVNIPWHLNTQGILFARVSDEGINWIKNEMALNRYGKHRVDQFWLPFSRPISEIKQGDVICIFNRRVAGWDGSHERPVIELLGAGGHLPILWKEDIGELQPLSFKENFKKEFSEELGMQIIENDIVIFGGYRNEITHELVVLCGIEIAEEVLPQIQEYAIQNIDEDTMGIYLGTFEEVIAYYRTTPDPFAGGTKSAPYNFPNREELMSRAIEYSKLI